ncbi:MAG: hypothetical protein JNG84_15545 [Archangium sp.]|nr:hypothetical protein [Archangium sp.]
MAGTYLTLDGFGTDFGYLRELAVVDPTKGQKVGRGVRQGAPGRRTVGPKRGGVRRSPLTRPLGAGIRPLASLLGG